MSRAARWTRTQITTEPGGSIVITVVTPPRWRWGKARVRQLVISLDDAATMQAQLDRLLNGSWAMSPTEQQARYRGAVN